MFIDTTFNQVINLSFLSSKSHTNKVLIPHNKESSKSFPENQEVQNNPILDYHMHDNFLTLIRNSFFSKIIEFKAGQMIFFLKRCYKQNSEASSLNKNV